MPIVEYETTDKVGAGNVRVSVTSRQCDTAGAGLFKSADGADADFFEAAKDGVEESEYTMECDGLLTEDSGRLCLLYTEPPAEDGEKCQTEITFEADSPNCVTINRTGEARTSFVVKEATRTVSVYNTPFGPLEMCIWAKKVSNSIGTDGGVLTMDYTVELKGLTAQRTKMCVSVRRRKP